jgi:putative tryptophan/tyrosine transport system substrate-binding protein
METYYRSLDCLGLRQSWWDQMTICHTRRRFVAALAGAAVMWPLSARPQQPASGKWRVAMLMPSRRRDVVRQGLRELGYVEGNNLVIEARPIERADRIATLAAELVGLKPDVIVATGTQATQAVQQATSSIPIVMTGSSDPVGTHLVASLAHPGGNVTGLSLFSPELSGKRLEMLRNVAGELSSLAVLWNPDDPPAAIALKETQNAAGAMRLQLVAAEARNADDLAPAFRTIAKAAPNALAILNAPLMSLQVARIAELALGLKLPSIYTDITFPQAGGLMSYGPNFDSLARRAAIYVDRILKGEKPADLPIEQPTKFDLVINLKTAKALGLNVPPSLLALADEVIE